MFRWHRLIWDHQNCKYMSDFQEQQQFYRKRNPNVKNTYFVNTYLSLVSLTARTYVLKLNSPMHLKLKSSHKNTLLVANLGFYPPPTSAKILVRNIISTIPMPPSSSITKWGILIEYLLLLCESLKGWLLKILNPLSVPHAKQP